jgi:hypothetical protein
MSQIYNINNNLNVSGNSKSLSVSATTISGITLTGQIDAKYIGSGLTIYDVPNLVTNQEFTYLSGLTGYTQTQINNKVPVSSPLLVYSASPLITNSLVVSAGTNIVTTSSTTNYTISAVIGSLEVGSILVITGGNQNYAVHNFNPTGWDSSYPNRATNIRIQPLNVIKITGLSGGITGRIATLTNVGNYPIILEYGSSESTSLNTFIFANNNSYFLNPKSSITLIYNHISQRWVEIQTDYQNGFNIFDTVDNVPGVQNTSFEITASVIPFGYGTKDFLVEINNGGVSNNGAAGFRGDVTGLRLYNTRSASVIPRIRVGANRFVNLTGFTSGSSFLYVTQINNITQGAGPAGFTSTSNTASIIGFENSFLSLPYTGLTSPTINTNPPSCSGGTFWLINHTGVTDYLRYVVQSTGNTTIISSSTFPVSAITSNSASFYELGVHYLNQSGGTNGWASFFYKLPGSTSWVIHEKINDNSMSIAGIPGNNFFGAYNQTTIPVSTEQSPHMYVKYIGMSITDLT